MRGWTGGRPLPPPAPLPPPPAPCLPPPSLERRAFRGAKFIFSFSLPPSFFSPLPHPAPPLPSSHPSSPSSGPFTSPSRPLISHLPLTLSAPSGIFVCAFQNFLSRFTRLLLSSKYNESACSVNVVRQFCGLPRKYQGCASFIYFLHICTELRKPIRAA